MNPNFEQFDGPPSLVEFKNQPRLSEHEVDRESNGRREELVPQIREFLSGDELFAGKKVEVEFSHMGVSSLVAVIECEGEKSVLKVPLLPTKEGESRFLKAWEAVGVTVPHVMREGNFGDNPYTLMSFVDAPTLREAITNGSAREDASVEMGKILAQMHGAKSEGYGRLVKGRPEHESFRDWVMDDNVQKMIRYVKEHGLLGDEHGSIEEAVDTLVAYNEAKPESVCCHFDFNVTNLMATEPFTVIDPEPMLNNGIIDIGRSVVLEVSRGKNGEEIKGGYFSAGRPYDEKALRAAILLNVHSKFVYWHKVNRVKSITRVRDYLSKVK